MLSEALHKGDHETAVRVILLGFEFGLIPVTILWALTEIYNYDHPTYINQPPNLNLNLE